MRILSSKDVSEILLRLTDSQLQKFRDGLSEALSDFSTQRASAASKPAIIQPSRTVMTTSRDITTLSMPATDTTYTSVKTVTVPPTGPIQGAITVFDAEGELLGLINAAEVTAFRTALTSMLALSISKWGHQSNASMNADASYNLVIFGSGKQAEWHARLALRFSTIRKLTLINRSRGRLQELQDTLLEDIKVSYPGVALVALSQRDNSDYNSQLQECLAEADIICCTTPSTTPLFEAEYLQRNPKSRFISLIGSYKPSMQEIDPKTLLSGFEKTVLVDSIEACLEEAGELIKAGVVKDQLVELGELFSGQGSAFHHETLSLLAPESASVIFKCVGMSLMDLCVSKILLDMGREQNVGTEMKDF